MMGRGGKQGVADFARWHRATILAWLCACVLMALPVPAGAQGPTVECATTTDLKDQNFCAAQDAQKANVDMEKAFESARQWGREINSLKEDAKADPVNILDVLELSQRGWIDYRDGQCLLQGRRNDDVLKSDMLASQCEASMTRRRTEELQLFMTGDGD